MELCVTAGGFFVALLLAASRRGESFFARCDQILDDLSASSRNAVLTILAVSMTAFAIPSLWHVPVPVVHDEFAYVLAGDTFAHGRLTNPPHPLARFFETFHVLQSPTYMAKFPPGTGLTLAAGQILGLPIAGIWICLTIGCVALFWMLRAAMPPRWALLIALLAALHPTVLWFSQTYWGGGVAMLGGAICGGAMLRAMRNPTVAMGLLAGAGLGLLAISRPFEGVLFALACAVAMTICALRDGKLGAMLARFLPGAIAIPILVGGWLAYYDWRVTGDALVMPYALHTQRYMTAPLFFWQGSRQDNSPIYPNEQMRQFHTKDEYDEYASKVGWPNYPIGILYRVGMIAWAYFRSMLLLIPFFIALAALRQRREVVVGGLICASVLLLHSAICPWTRIAYMAPLFGLLLVILGLGLQRIESWQPEEKPVGRAMVRALILTQLCVSIFSLIVMTRGNAGSVFSRRAQIVASLERLGGQHLVLVHYGKEHTPAAEWIYNAADIDHSPVILARDFGLEVDQPLLRYHAGRTVWRLDVNNRQVELHPLNDRRQDSNSEVASRASLPAAQALAR